MTSTPTGPTNRISSYLANLSNICAAETSKRRTYPSILLFPNGEKKFVKTYEPLSWPSNFQIKKRIYNEVFNEEIIELQEVEQTTQMYNFSSEKEIIARLEASEEQLNVKEIAQLKNIKSDTEELRKQTRSIHSDKTIEAHVDRRRSFQMPDGPAPKKARKIDLETEEDYDFVRSAKIKKTDADEFSIFGEHVACKIRNLKDRRSQSIAQYEISSILFQIEMGNYTYSTDSSNNVTDVAAPQFELDAEKVLDTDARTSKAPQSTPFSALSRSSSSTVRVSDSPIPQDCKLSPQSIQSSAAEDTD